MDHSGRAISLSSSPPDHAQIPTVGYRALYVLCDTDFYRRPVHVLAHVLYGTAVLLLTKSTMYSLRVLSAESMQTVRTVVHVERESRDACVQTRQTVFVPSSSGACATTSRDEAVREVRARSCILQCSALQAALPRLQRCATFAVRAASAAQTAGLSPT